MKTTRLGVLVLMGVVGLSGMLNGVPARSQRRAEPPATSAPLPTPAEGRVIDSADAFKVLPPHARVAPENAILQDRLTTLLPRLMQDAGLDMWLVINREYAEDPVYFTLVPQPSFAARRTTMLVFFRRPDGTVERLAVNRYPLGPPYESAWSGGDLKAQWAALAAVVAARNPARIGVDTSRLWPEADGLTAGLQQQLLEALPEAMRARVVSAEGLVVRWLETRSAAELALYPHIDSIARGVISEAFSGRVITPGVTTTDEVAWYIRERFEALGLRIWFMPTVDFQRRGDRCDEQAPHCGAEGRIEVGDVLHTDVGFCYLKLCTDTQEMGYVLGSSQTDVPAGFKQALAAGNRWQDLLTGQFRTGRTGNEVLALTRAATAEEGLVTRTYSHPLGYFGHAPGPTIGMWDNQGPTVGTGDWPLHPDTVYAIEGNAKAQVAAWDGQWLQIMLEQGAWFDGTAVHYLAGRQTQWHLIR